MLDNPGLHVLSRVGLGKEGSSPPGSRGGKTGGRGLLVAPGMWGLTEVRPHATVEETAWGEVEYRNVMSFYVDADDQRARARRTEHVFHEHNARREQKLREQGQRVDWRAVDDPANNLPPVFLDPTSGEYSHARDPSGDRRNARFRDQHIYGPPPPLPARYNDPEFGVPRVLPPQKFLVPQQVADQGITNDPRYRVLSPPHPMPQVPPNPSPYPYPQPHGYPPPPPPASPAAFLLPPEVAMQVYQNQRQQYPPVDTSYEQDAGTASLTPSQKKRLRKKRAKLARTAQTTPAPPGPVSVPAHERTNGHAPQAHALPSFSPPAPDPRYSEQRRTCSHEVIVALPYQGQWVSHRFVCPLSPFPHPGQPHLLRLQDAQGGDTDIFVGWWEPDEVPQR